MTAEQWQLVRDLFEAALEQDSGDVRSWLDRQAIDDPSVRAEVQSLLDHHSRAGSFLVEPVARRVPELLQEEQGLEQGAVLGPYTIQRELGRGAMGRVYLASDARLGRSVALKVLAPHLVGDPSHRERLRREAQAAAALTHPGICTVYALEDIGGHLVIATEVVDGHTLREEISAGRPPTEEMIAATSRELAEALASAHAKGITHRDLKPENIMRDRNGRLKILDFGLARTHEPIGSAPPAMAPTMPGVLIGTPAYMAPEQLNSQPADARTDVFAYGVVMYEYACGVHPFDAATSLGLIARVLESEARPIADRCRTVSPIIASVVDRCLQKSPAQRFASASDIVTALQQPDFGVPSSRQERRRAIWWRLHQLTAIVLYISAATIAWNIKEGFVGPVSLWLFVALGILSAIGGISRGHLVFTELVNRPSLSRERRRVKYLTGAVDLLIALGLALDALRIASVRPLWAVLTMALAIGIALAAILMEPATTTAVFHE